MKVLHCLNHFLPEQTAGTEVYTWALCKGLQRQRIVAEVAIPGYGQERSTDYEYDGIKVHRFAEPSVVDRSLQMGFTVARGVSFFKELLDRVKPDIVHFHELAGSNGLSLHHVMAAKAAGVKTLMTFHIAEYTCKAKTLLFKDSVLCDGMIDVYRCTDCNLSRQLAPSTAGMVVKAARLLYGLHINLSSIPSKAATALSYPFLVKKLRSDLHLLAGHCDQFVVITRWYREILLRNGISEQQIALVTQGLVQQPVSSTNRERKTANALRLVFVGRISHFKGLHLVLDAIEAFPNGKVTLDIYGGGDDAYAQTCKARIEKMGRVVYHGLLDPSRVVDTMQDYDALVLASTFSEMSPLVIQEAFAAGIPVIASSVYGNAEQIKDGVNGWLFQFNDSNDLHRVLKMLVATPALLEAARQHVPMVKPFEQVVQAYIPLYERLLN